MRHWRARCRTLLLTFAAHAWILALDLLLVLVGVVLGLLLCGGPHAGR